MSATHDLDARLWRTQLRTLVATEVRRSLLSARAVPVLLMVAMPLALMVLRLAFMPDVLRQAPTRAVTEFAEVFHFFILRFIVFFANALIFVRLFRGEIVEQTLHYTLMVPLSRRLLVLGKFLGGLLSALALLVPATGLTYVLVYLPHRGGLELLLAWPSIWHLLVYEFIVLLACCAYGALFLVAGLHFRNPMVPAAIFLGWEMLTPFLPPMLKYLSFVHYLASFAPVPVSVRAFSLLAQPVPWWAAVASLVAATAALLAAAVGSARRLEISYTNE